MHVPRLQRANQGARPVLAPPRRTHLVHADADEDDLLAAVAHQRRKV
jgi:hypothetical protein